MKVAIAPAASSATARTAASSESGVVREQEVTAGDRRDQRDLVAVGEARVGSGIALVERIEQTRRLGSEVERRPDVRDRRAVGELEGATTGARALAKPRKETNRDLHRRSVPRLP